MARGDVQVAGRKRKPPEAARIAKRVAKHCDLWPAAPTGVQPLNPGFFALEQMRFQTVQANKARAKKRAKVRGK